MAAKQGDRMGQGHWDLCVEYGAEISPESGGHNAHGFAVG